MPEKEPLYFKKFRIHFDKKLDASFENFAGMMKRQFDFIDEKFKKVNTRFTYIEGEINMIKETMDTKMATKDDLERIHSHIGKFEQRLHPIEENIYA
jgi:hypothetical protein